MEGKEEPGAAEEQGGEDQVVAIVRWVDVVNLMNITMTMMTISMMTITMTMMTMTTLLMMT